MTLGEKALRSLQGQKELESQLTLGFVPRQTRKFYSVACGFADVTLQIEIEDFDRFGLVLRGMRFQLPVSDVEADSGGRFQHLAAALAGGVSHLGGELQVIESDDDLGVAILRTMPNTTGRFFEIRLQHGGELTLNHFSVHRETRKRTETPANMSTESFVLLVDQLFELISR